MHNTHSGGWKFCCPPLTAEYGRPLPGILPQSDLSLHSLAHSLVCSNQYGLRYSEFIFRTRREGVLLFVQVQRPGKTETADGHIGKLLASLRATGHPSHTRLRTHDSELPATRTSQTPTCCRKGAQSANARDHHAKHPAACVSAHPCLCARTPPSSKWQIPHAMLMNTPSQCPENSEDLELTLRPLAQTCVCGGACSDQDSHLRIKPSCRP